jgi:outer membrane immunogenic protein
MRKSLFALATVAAALFSTAAMADGMIKGKAKGGSMKDAPAPVAERHCSSGPFAGFFIGGHVGYAWGRSDYSHSHPNSLSADNDDGFVGGVGWGYNWQCDRLVVGLVSDLSFGDIKSTVDYGGGDRLVETINWYGTSRVKVGVAHDHTLFYFTAGLAYADLDWKLRTGCCGAAENSDRKFGWTIGGGVEFIRDNRWSLGLEMLYVDLRDTDIHYFATVGCAVTVCDLRTKWEDEFLVARLNLSIKLGHREEHHAPLK